MILNKIRKGQLGKSLAVYLTLQLLLQIFYPTTIWALTGGPKQPEFNSFTPIGTSDMVDLSSGDFNYNIPIMDVGGYPLNLSYQSGITMDQEASWVGLGWNLNVGQINRNVRGIPDDFKGDEMITENYLRDNVTVTAGATVDAQLFGLELPDQIGLKVGANLTYNNYTGVSFSPSLGLSYSVSNNLAVGMQLNGSATNGANVSPYVNLKTNPFLEKLFTASLNAGISYNSVAGLSSFNMSVSLEASQPMYGFEKGDDGKFSLNYQGNQGGSSVLGGSGNISFANTTITPRKRTAFIDEAGTFAASFGGDIWGGDGELEGSASASIQKLKNPVKKDKAYGYDFTGFATREDLLDYNRENDQLISKTTLALPVTNYTYDTYRVQAQGLSGMFRPYRNQVGQINDEYVADASESFSFGAEVEPGTGFHTGANFTKVESDSHTGVWDTSALKYFKQANEDQKRGAEEPVYYKYVGENHVDRDPNLFSERLGGYSPIALKLGGTGYDTYGAPTYRVKEYKDKQIIEGREVNSLPVYREVPFNTPFRREKRVLRNQNIQKINKAELFHHYKSGDYYNNWLIRNSLAKNHHTAEIRVQNAQGASYVFGEPAYNKSKAEVSFTTDKLGDCTTGIVNYNPGENSNRNRSGKDNFFNKVITPPYAHTYLLSSILSSDYEDLTGDGPSDDDLGSYTKFEYVKNDHSNYKWRVPFGRYEASYDMGLNTDAADQKGSYVYGEKEIKYIKTISTKTHIAVFTTSPRKDAKGVADEDGGYRNGSLVGGSMYQLDKIELYSKPEYIKAQESSFEALPIKTAHFEYSYDLCPGIINHQDFNANISPNENPGKLTLNKVYFTYRDSNMGKYTPYKFNYEGFNPSYNLKGYDIWGNYKPNEGGCNTQDPITAPEFPYVQQDDKELQDQYASAWALTSINLPSGGKINLEYETDDYQFVQNKNTMQMIKIVGAGTSLTPNQEQLHNTKMYNASTGGDVRYLYVKLPVKVTSVEEFKLKYLNQIADDPIYFRFLMNMTNHGRRANSNSRDYDYVTGYFNIEKDKINFLGQKIELGIFDDGNYAAIPMQFVDLEGGLSGNSQINPITKAGLYFARRYLNAQSLGVASDYRKQDVESIVNNIIASFNSFKGLFTGPNQELRKDGYSVAKRFIPEKSWIRLTTPRANKLGGGCRVKKLEMKDNWREMVEGTSERYDKRYGQEYSYKLEDNTTSGVATFEPNMSKENPFVEPFYNDGDRLVAPKELSYVEKPFGASFFPSPRVTYSRVTVSNLEKTGVKKHATGRVVTIHFTSKDFPTKVDYTEIDGPDRAHSIQGSILLEALKSAVGARVDNNTTYTLSQGYMVHTNDMDGKEKSQVVYPEDSDIPVSSVVNVYQTKSNAEKELNNKVAVISKTGDVEYDQEIGVDYDVVMDFRESYSRVETRGVKANLVILVLFCAPVVTIPVPTVFPVNINHINVAHSVITTKVIHTTAIMKEKIATDLGATVTTTNEAWDKNTGQVLLTKTENEYGDQYYNFSYPAYWAYQNMGMASNNIGIEGTLVPTNNGYFNYTNNSVDAASHFQTGDEILGSYLNRTERFWVVNKEGKNVQLMNRIGNVINKAGSVEDQNKGNFVRIDQPINFKIIRSGYRNLQHTNMGAITLQKDPLSGGINKITPSTFQQNAGQENKLKIVNASAITYADFWNPQCERGLPSISALIDNPEALEKLDISQYGFNPYLLNAKGEWKPKKSYAYLTKRNNLNSNQGVSIREEGFFNEFSPYYTITSSGNWQVNVSNSRKWTAASEVTQYSPYGAELENKDALNRYSSAQYGYHYTLPTAVASNSRYRHMGVDNMEDYNSPTQLPRGVAPSLNRPENSSEQEHFSFKDASLKDGPSGIEITDQVAHTGVHSLLVPNRDKAQIQRPLKGEIEPKKLDTDKDGFTDDVDTCPYVFNPGNSQYDDYDRDGLPDACDDTALPKVINPVYHHDVTAVNGIIVPPIRNQRGQTITQTTNRPLRICDGNGWTFRVIAKPNQIIRYRIISDHPCQNWAARVNGRFVADTHNKGKIRTLKTNHLGFLDVSFDVFGFRDGYWTGCTFELLHSFTNDVIFRQYQDEKPRRSCNGLRNSNPIEP